MAKYMNPNDPKTKAFLKWLAGFPVFMDVFKAYCVINNAWKEPKNGQVDPFYIYLYIQRILAEVSEDYEDLDLLYYIEYKFIFAIFFIQLTTKLDSTGYKFKLSLEGTKFKMPAKECLLELTPKSYATYNTSKLIFSLKNVDGSNKLEDELLLLKGFLGSNIAVKFSPIVAKDFRQILSKLMRWDFKSVETPVVMEIESLGSSGDFVEYIAFNKISPDIIKERLKEYCDKLIDKII